MGLLDVLYVASMPIVKVLLISGLGAILSTRYFDVLTDDSRKSLNKIVFVVFTPALLFSSLAESVTFEDLISWWSMPVNVLFTFIIGSALGWLVVRITKTPKDLQGIVVSNCCAGNMGNLLLILIPNLCDESGSPFGDSSTCSVKGTAYVSFSMALGSILIWTYAYSIIRSSSEHKTDELEEGLLEKVQSSGSSNSPRPSISTTHEPCSDGYLLKKHSFSGRFLFPEEERTASIWYEKITHGIADVCHLIWDELKSPPTIAVIAGFFVGAISLVKKLFVGDSAPLHVVQDSITLLGDGTIPSVTLVLGGNLLQGLKSSRLKTAVIPLVIAVKFILMPLAGLFIVKGASYLGMLPDDRLYQFILMIQYAVPPAMILGTMAQLFNVGEQECSVLFFWMYLAASIALTIWSTVFMLVLV